VPIRKRKPTSPGRRFQTSSDFVEVTKTKPEKALTKPKPKTGGRNSYGRMTSRHRGGGHKQRYRIVDFRRNKDGVPAKVAAIEYDPNRNARLALLHYLDGEKRYIIAAQGLEVGAMVQSGQGSEIRVGNALPLRYIPVGTTVHNVELKPGAGAKMGRGAGVAIQLIAKEGAFATLRLPSTESGTTANTWVPFPGFDSTANLPCTRCARSCILIIPSPRLFFASSTSKPAPASITSS